MPIPKDEKDMEGHGWSKDLTIKHIEIKKGVIFCEEWDFFADAMSCNVREGGTSGPKCGTDHTWVTCIGGKLFWSCFRHRIANGPITFEVGHKSKEYIIGASEALEICKGTNQTPPRELVDVYQQEFAEKTAGKRRRPTTTK